MGSLGHTVVMMKDALEEVSIEEEYYPSKLQWHGDFLAHNAIALRYGACYIPGAYSVFRVVNSSYSNKGISWKRRRELYGAMLTLLNSPQYVDLKPLFKDSNLFVEFSYSMLGTILLQPSFHDYLTFSYLKAVSRELLWRGARNIGLKIPGVRALYRKAQNFIS